jgi:hypothetical protein
MIRTKKAVELSINFLVMMIIALTIFAFGVRFVYKISAGAIELKDLTADELDAKVDDLLCSSSTKVCIGKDTQTVPRGEFKAYGIKILNVEDEQDFTILVQQRGPDIGFKKDGTPITNSMAEGDKNISFAPVERELLNIPRNGEQLIGVGVSVPKSAISGTYILNVKILKKKLASVDGAERTMTDCSDPDCYVSLQKLYVNVP